MLASSSIPSGPLQGHFPIRTLSPIGRVPPPVDLHVKFQQPPPRADIHDYMQDLLLPLPPLTCVQTPGPQLHDERLQPRHAGEPGPEFLPKTIAVPIAPGNGFGEPGADGGVSDEVEVTDGGETGGRE
ncbi:MAG: hypothetical protein Q9160_005844 [Pyrenula sp. 1 TL-2023]